MDNSFKLVATLHQVKVLRYSPAGIPILDVLLFHSSMQNENGLSHQIKFELPAKIIGKQAELWQYKEGEQVLVSGFLAQKNQKSFQPLLHIQNIQEYKG